MNQFQIDQLQRNNGAKSTIFGNLVDAARRFPEKIAIYHGSDSLTFLDVLSQVIRLTAWIELETREFDRVAIYIDKRPEFIYWLYACIATKRIFVPINPVLKSLQVQQVLEDSGARILVTSTPRMRQLTASGLSLENVSAVMIDSFDMIGGGPRLPTAQILDSDPAVILYTSGSSGKPKGVVLSHRNLTAGAESVTHYLRLTPEDIILSVLPLSFDAGLNQVTTSILSGASVVLCQFLRAEEVVALCERFSVSVITAVPPLWHQLVNAHWREEDSKSVRVVANTGGHMPEALLRKIRMTFSSAHPYLMYGLTESFRSTYLDPSEIDRRPNSIGKAVPNAEILVLNAKGQECAPFERGELVHRGPFVTLGYWNSPELTKSKFRPVPRKLEAIPTSEIGVWSGDEVYRDEEGFLYYVARMDEQIKTSGYRVSPTEVEEVILKSGLVGETVVFGAPHEQLGQAIVAVVSRQSSDFSQDRLILECKRALPTYMIPQKVISLLEIPRNPNGKFDRKYLTTEYSRMFQAGGPNHD
jgi:acyl-CoA ligase (AMP-forming) (exosortase A-associated)